MALETLKIAVNELRPVLAVGCPELFSTSHHG
jgi:hypothetical protein